MNAPTTDAARRPVERQEEGFLGGSVGLDEEEEEDDDVNQAAAGTATPPPTVEMTVRAVSM